MQHSRGFGDDVIYELTFCIMLHYEGFYIISCLISSGTSDICGQFQSPAVKSERGPRSAEPYNATLLIGMSIILSFCNVCCSTFIF